MPWVNVADLQDIVAGTIDLFPSMGIPPQIGALEKVHDIR